MPFREDELIPTRASLIGRLKDWQDQKSWEEFFNTYWKLIYGVARKTGLSDAEAQDVVQDTMATVVRQMPNFTYNPAIGSFKGWLLNTTRWKIANQFRKRGPVSHAEHPPGETGTSTDPMHYIPDDSIRTVEEIWDSEWQQNVFEAAMQKVKQKADPHKYQIFDLYVNKDWTVEKIAKVFNVSADQIYLIKHRLMEQIKEEVKRLENEML